MFKPALLFLPVLLTACVNLAPEPATPQLPAYPDALPSSADTATAAATEASTLAWNDYFVDPELQALIRLALANNRDLRASVLRMEEARAVFGIQRADQFPTVNAGAGASRSLTPGDLNLSGAPLYASQYQVNLGTSAWEIDFWGRVRNLKTAALENYLASDAARQAATLSLIASVAYAYANLCELNERIDLAGQTTRSSEETYRIFSRRVDMGATSRLDLTQVGLLRDQAQRLGAQLEQARAAELHALVGLAGALPDVGAGQARCTERTLLPELRVGLPSELLTARPDIIAAEHRLRAAHANVGAARAAFFPRIALTGSYGSASAELGGLFAAGSKAWSFVPVLSVPLFDAGRNRSSLELAEVRRELAVVNYEKTIETAFREVADALSNHDWLRRQLDYQQRSVAAQRERLRLARLRYDNGAIAYFEVLDAQRELLAAEQLLVQLRRALLASRIALYAALGGGSRAAPEIPATHAAPRE